MPCVSSDLMSPAMRPGMCVGVRERHALVTAIARQISKVVTCITPASADLREINVP
ncbi:hypothetical protein BRAS3843_2720021 [Bradyrhizobium sp. STM 3843]|nr:hypothetical protein BRAS3843_2720021 [Bradyrhizobium sp. STM 3843]